MSLKTSEIVYVQPEIPPLPERRPRGRTYTDTVPATLDLTDRARLAVNGMTEPTDAEADYRVYWKVSFRANPPVMYHDISDTGITLKFLEAVPRMRIMSGSEQGLYVEQRWKEVLLHMISPDGTVATPLSGLPYLRAGRSGLFAGDQIIDQQVNGIALGAVAMLAVLEDQSFWEPIGRGIVSGLRRMTVQQGDIAYLSDWNFAPGQQADPTRQRPQGTYAAYAMWPARRLVDFYQATGYTPALELAGQLCRYMPDSNYFGPNYEFLPDGPTPDDPRFHVIHFHHHAMTLLTCLEYGLAATDDALLDFVQKAFPVARTYGEVLTGFFPESVSLNRPQSHRDRDHTCELCEVGDMVRLAVRLAASGFGDSYWDDADRWVRNQLAEGQFLRHDWIDRLHVGDPLSQIDTEGQWPMTTERVGERNIGAFGGWQSPNDWVEFARYPVGGPRGARMGHVQGIMHCCTANASRALYDTWLHTVHVEGDLVRVNLLMNHASAQVDIHSHLPYTGQVDLHIKTLCRLDVRMPAWVNLNEVRCVVGGEERAAHFAGRYAEVGTVQPGETVTLTFPIGETTDSIHIDNHRYFLVRKGHDVVAIDPPGLLCPLYQRDHYRDPRTLWHSTTRYVDEQRLSW